MNANRTPGRKLGFGLLIGTGLVLAWPGMAKAQDSDPFGSIEGRFRPEYTTPPIRVGAFEISPRIEVEAEYIDNLFASDVLSVSDTVVSIRPQVTVRDRRPDRELRLDASAGYAVYVDNSVDDRLQVRARATSRFGLGTRTRPFFGAFIQQNDSTNSTFEQFRDTAQPISLISYGANGGLDQNFGPFTATAEARHQRTEYQGNDVIAGIPVDSGYRDSALTNVRARLAYSVNPAQRIYVEAEFNARDYGAAIGLPAAPGLFLGDRSSDGFKLRAGYARQLTELLLIDVSVGLLRQNYDDPAFSDISTASFDANLYYSPSRLTRFQLRASRSLDATVNPLFNGLLRTEFAGAVEHELLRNLILSAEARYTVIESDDGVDDSEERRISAQARYLISPHWSVKLRAEHFSRSGVYDGRQTRALLAAVYSF